MKDNTQSRRSTCIALIFAAITFLLTYWVLRSVKLYGDDYFYHTFVTDGMREFWQAHKNHYLYANGRAIVHILAAAFLALPPVVWQIANGVMLGLFVFLGAKIVSAHCSPCPPLRCFCVSAVLCAAILFLDIRVSNQSVYWLTGSWNYVYPMVLLLLYWWLLERRGNSRLSAVLVCAAAFLSSATTEQNAMMTIGLGVLYWIDRKWIKKEKIDAVLIAAIAISVVGAASVLLAPSQFTRTLDEQSKVQVPFGQMLHNNIKEQCSQFFNGIYMVPYQTMLLAATGLFLFVSSNRFRFVGNILTKFVACLALPVIYLVQIWAAGVEDVLTVEQVRVVAVMAFYYMLAGGLVFGTLLRTKRPGYFVPMVAAILCVGSQLMMLVSPVFGPRTVLCAIFMMSVYSAALLGMTFRYEHASAERWAVFGVLSLALLVGGFRTIRTTAVGYQENAPVDVENRRLVQEYLDSNGDDLYQYKLKDEFYGWSMPYNSPYHEEYYKIYHQIPLPTEIRWISFGESAAEENSQ